MTIPCRCDGPRAPVASTGRCVLGLLIEASCLTIDRPKPVPWSRQGAETPLSALACLRYSTNTPRFESSFLFVVLILGFRRRTLRNLGDVGLRDALCG